MYSSRATFGVARMLLQTRNPRNAPSEPGPQQAATCSAAAPAAKFDAEPRERSLGEC